MKLLSALKAERTVSVLLEEPSSTTPAAKKALESLKKAGPGALPILIDSLGGADKHQTIGIVETLAEKLSERTIEYFINGLKHPNERCVTGVARAMSSTNTFNANKLFKYLDVDDVSKPAILDVLRAHAPKLNIREALTMAYTLEPQDKAAMFKLISEMATDDFVPELIARLGGSDTLARIHIIKILAKFNRPDVGKALEEQLADSHKWIRKTVLEALTKFDFSERNIKLICSMLQDSDLEVQSKAVDLIVMMRHPQTVRYLVEALKDESEFTRRSAVEVLNELADINTLKHLLSVIADDDWWVRTRAADALASIGGPKVMNAVMKLIRDKDENVRRSAIEILNQTKDEKAVAHLIEATKDNDWWVRERAVDALGEIGSTKAVPALTSMLTGDAKTVPSVLRALGKLGQTEVASQIMPLLERTEKEIRVEAINALSMLASDDMTDAIKLKMQALQSTGDSTISKAVSDALLRIDSQFAGSRIGEKDKTELLAEPAHTLLLDKATVEETIKRMADTPQLDINVLRPGDVIEGRYSYIEQIGKGAFGTVILVEDAVVGEQLILKFLNANVSSDEEMMKRFVHELRFSRKITHENVIRIYDFLSLSGKYAISMEYFPSHTLSVELTKNKPMPLEKAAGWARDIATGMSVAHGVGIVHRDLKPANLLINDDGLLKIVDFGVAAAASSGDTQLTKTGYVIGSPKYMAPEQILGKQVDHRADIYSLGVIIYEMLTGVPPYTKGDHMAVMYQHVQGRAKPCQEVNPAIPAPLAEIVGRTMAVDKTKRYDSMDELISVLAKAI